MATSSAGPSSSGGVDQKQLDWLHCNACMAQGGALLVTKCGHVFCERCKATAGNKCPVCGKEVVQLISLTTELQRRGEVGHCFSDVVGVVKRFVQALEFQKNHRLRLWEHDKHQLTESEDEVEWEEAELKKRCSKLEEDIRALEEEERELAPQLQALEREWQDLTSTLQGLSTSCPASPHSSPLLPPSYSGNAMPPPRLPPPRTYRVMPCGGDLTVTPSQIAVASPLPPKISGGMVHYPTPPSTWTTPTRTTVVPSQLSARLMSCRQARPPSDPRRQSLYSPSPQKMAPPSVKRPFSPSPVQKLPGGGLSNDTYLPRPKPLKRMKTGGTRSASPSPRQPLQWARASATVRRTPTQPLPPPPCTAVRVTRQELSGDRQPSPSHRKMETPSISTKRISVRGPPVNGRIGTIPHQPSPNSSVYKLLRERGLKVPGPIPSPSIRLDAVSNRQSPVLFSHGRSPYPRPPYVR